MTIVADARRILVACFVACAGGAAAASAQDYPVKPIRMVVPFPPGGFSDVFARIIGGKMNESWGQ
ncbi:MAG TPA: tripartite tricarboxylate transporter substrate binding protein, partial [Burkholderiales bacterium]|nr:tripartite tricarboxylate transporter substrate binding protein [Burkholderiales bacterium]